MKKKDRLRRIWDSAYADTKSQNIQFPWQADIDHYLMYPHLCFSLIKGRWAGRDLGVECSRVERSRSVLITLSRSSLPFTRLKKAFCVQCVFHSIGWIKDPTPWCLDPDPNIPISCRRPRSPCMAGVIRTWSKALGSESFARPAS